MLVPVGFSLGRKTRWLVTSWLLYDTVTTVTRTVTVSVAKFFSGPVFM